MRTITGALLPDLRVLCVVNALFYILVMLDDSINCDSLPCSSGGCDECIFHDRFTGER